MIVTDRLMLPKKTVVTLVTWTKRGVWNGPNGVKPAAGDGDDIDEEEEELPLMAPELSQINEQPPLPIVLVKLALRVTPKIAVKTVWFVMSDTGIPS